MIRKSDLEVLGDLRTALDRAVPALDLRIEKGTPLLILLLPDNSTYEFIFEVKDEIKAILRVEDIFKVKGLEAPLVAYSQSLFFPVIEPVSNEIDKELGCH